MFVYGRCHGGSNEVDNDVLLVGLESQVKCNSHLMIATAHDVGIHGCHISMHQAAGLG